MGTGGRRFQQTYNPESGTHRCYVCDIGTVTSSTETETQRLHHPQTGTQPHSRHSTSYSYLTPCYIILPLPKSSPSFNFHSLSLFHHCPFSISDYKTSYCVETTLSGNRLISGQVQLRQTQTSFRYLRQTFDLQTTSLHR